MTGRGIQVYTDENISPKLAQQLRHHGYDAISCHDADYANQGIDDESQLSFAASEGRALLTRNNADFILLDVTWKVDGRKHAGIICVSKPYPLGELVRRTIQHLNEYTPEQQYNLVLWI